jgi:hypothetical protein
VDGLVGFILVGLVVRVDIVGIGVGEHWHYSSYLVILNMADNEVTTSSTSFPL